MKTSVSSGMKLRRPESSALLARRPGGETFFNQAGALNADNGKDAIMQLGALISAASQNQLVFKTPDEIEKSNVTVATSRELVKAAYSDRTGPRWMETAAAIGAELSETSDREGFMRRLFIRGEVAQGAQPRVRLRWKNVTAIVASSASQNQAVFARDKYFYPPEFYVTGNVRIEEREIQQGSGDLLEDAYFNTMEQIMVKEDKIWKTQADASVNLLNPLQVLAGGMTPASLVAMRTTITRWGIPAQMMVMASDLWNDIIGNAAAFGNLFDPVTQFEIIQTGYLGTLLGMGIITDAFRYPQLKVLNSGEVYILGAPEQHGVYTDRGPVASEPRDSFNDGVPARGWFFYELLSMTLVNARLVVKGLRS